MSIFDYLIVLPAHNEEGFLYSTVARVHDFLSQISRNFLIAIAEDGSTDGTFSIAKSLEQRYSRVVSIHEVEKLGRGCAVERIWASFNSKIYCYMDCDLAADPAYLTNLLLSIRDGVDFVTGSRYLSNSVAIRPPLRRTVSRIYNYIVRFLFRTGCSDHQCGFKSMSFKATRKIFSRTSCSGWAWDTEIIVIAKHMGLHVKEIPIVWIEKRGNRTPIKRLLNDVVEHGWWILKLLFTQSFTTTRLKMGAWKLSSEEIERILARVKWLKEEYPISH